MISTAGSGMSWNDAFGGPLEAYITMVNGPHNGCETQLVMSEIATDLRGYCLMFDSSSGHYELRRHSDSFTQSAIRSGFRAINPGDKIGMRRIGPTIEMWYFAAGSWMQFDSVNDGLYTPTVLGLKVSGELDILDAFGGGGVRSLYPYQSAFMSLGPRCYWPLINGSGEAFAGNTMTPDGGIGRPGPAAALVGGSPGATNFKEPNEHIMYAAHDASINFDGNVPFTLLWWMRGGGNSTFGGDFNILTQRDDAGLFPGWQAYWGFADAQRVSLVFDEGAGGEDTAFLLGVTDKSLVRFIVCRYDGIDTLWGYSNGEYITNWTVGNEIANSGVAVPTYIAANQSGANTYNGDLSDIGILDYAITDEQVNSLWQAGSGAFPAAQAQPTVHGRGAA